MSQENTQAALAAYAVLTPDIDAAPFVHLRVHTSYSLLQGAIAPKDLVKAAAKAGMPAIAATDTDNLFGSLAFSLAAQDAGIQPIIGALVSVKPWGYKARPKEAPESRVHLVLLAQNEAGYANLMRLVSMAHMTPDRGVPPQVTIEQVRDLSAGLICLTGGPGGPIGSAILHLPGDTAKTVAAARLRDLKTVFGDRLYMEIMRHGMPEEETTEPVFLDLAYEQDVPLVATNDVHFLGEEMYQPHDALLCIAQKKHVGTQDRHRLTQHHGLRSSNEMRAVFSDLPEAILNTSRISMRCAVSSPNRNPILPKFSDDESEDLRRQTFEGLRGRLRDHVFPTCSSEDDRLAAEQTYLERAEYELGIINKMGFPGYFLIVSDFIKWGKANGIPVGPGRGSGAGSIVAWSLHITDLDPIRWGLLFERFLNPDRVSMPDFDVDFCQTRREEVIDYVTRKYGRDRVAQIITFGKLKARNAVRDIGRVMQLPFGLVDRVARLIPDKPSEAVTLDEALGIVAGGQKELPELVDLYNEDLEVRGLLDTARRVEGFYRNASTHAAGVVIGDRPLDQLVALYRDPKTGTPVTQFDMKFVEQAGLVKFDFLGLKTLSVIRQIQNGIRRDFDPVFDIDHITLTDAKAYELIASGHNAGVFQLEGAGMSKWAVKMKVDRFEDAIALVALYRPGPMDFIPDYIERKLGDVEDDPSWYAHPLLQPVLKETFGIMVYQEQVMQAAQVLAGYSLGGADLLRRAMGKKIKEEMDKQRAVFVKGCVENPAFLEGDAADPLYWRQRPGGGPDERDPTRTITNPDAPERLTVAERAEYIFDVIAQFANYGFNKSHAAAYALVAYQTAYLKAHYPAHFLAGTMTYDAGNTEKLAYMVGEARRLGIPVLPPCINRSVVTFDVEKTADGTFALRYGLGAVRNVGAGMLEVVVRERQDNGPFKSFQDFIGRLKSVGAQFTKKHIEILINAGAFDAIESDRALLAGNAEAIITTAANKKDKAAAVEMTARKQGAEQFSLFSMAPEIAPKDYGVLDPSKRQKWTETERASRELTAIGFFLGAHPFDAFEYLRKFMKVQESSVIRETTASAERSGDGRASRSVRLLAQIVDAKEGTDFHGNPSMRFFLNDRDGDYAAALDTKGGGAAELLERAKIYKNDRCAVLLDAQISVWDGGTSVKIRNITSLNDWRLGPLEIHLDVTSTAAEDAVGQVLSKLEGHGETDVVVMRAEEEGPVIYRKCILTMADLTELSIIQGVEIVRDAIVEKAPDIDAIMRRTGGDHDEDDDEEDAPRRRRGGFASLRSSGPSYAA